MNETREDLDKRIGLPEGISINHASEVASKRACNKLREVFKETMNIPHPTKGNLDYSDDNVVIKEFTDEWTWYMQGWKDTYDIINTPEVEDFLNGVKIEATHQIEKWGAEHEEGKYPHDYSLVLDKLKGKQALAIWDRNIEKYKHHLITMAAVCHNIHRQIDKPGTNINHFFNPERK